jgi:hypothetical protein
VAAQGVEFGRVSSSVAAVSRCGFGTGLSYYSRPLPEEEWSMQSGQAPSDPFESAPPPHSANIAVYLILTLLTCGLFNLYWNYRQMESCNELLGRDEFSFWLWLVFTILTCGLYHLYYQYTMGAAINEIQYQLGRPVTEGLPVLSVVAAFIGVGVVADCIHQHELNRIDADLEG